MLDLNEEGKIFRNNLKKKSLVFISIWYKCHITFRK